MNQARWRLPNGWWLRKLEGDGNMVHIWWVWCGVMVDPPSTYITQSRKEVMMMFECSKERLGQPLRKGS